MIIAIDYDETYTRNPQMWDKVIDTLLWHGNKVICATSRRNTMMEKIYNRQTKNKIALAFLAKEAARQRSAVKNKTA